VSMKATKFLFGSIGLLVLGALAPAPASASFGAPLNIASPNQAADGTQVTTNAVGDAAFVWVRKTTTPHRVVGRTLTAEGALSPVMVFSPPGLAATFERVALDADGDAVFAWSSRVGTQDHVQARTLSSAGVLGPVMDVSAPGTDTLSVELAMNASGDAVLAWVLDNPGTQPNRVQVRRLSPAGVLGPIQTITPPRTDVGFTDVGVDEAGDAVFVWGLFLNPIRSQTRGLSAAGVLSPIKTLAPPNEDSSDPKLAVDADGDAVFSWARVPSGVDEFIARTRTRSAAGELSRIQNYATVPIIGNEFWDPDVAIDADGDAVFAWLGRDGTNWRLQTRARSASGVLSPSQYLSIAGQDASPDVPPRVGMTSGGSAVFAWEQTASPSNVIQARVRDPDGSLRATQTVTNPGETPALVNGDISVVGDSAALGWIDGGAIRGSLGP
jgi:hypothetical protein